MEFGQPSMWLVSEALGSRWVEGPCGPSLASVALDPCSRLALTVLSRLRLPSRAGSPLSSTLPQAGESIPSPSFPKYHLSQSCCVTDSAEGSGIQEAELEASLEQTPGTSGWRLWPWCWTHSPLIPTLTRPSLTLGLVLPSPPQSPPPPRPGWAAPGLRPLTAMWMPALYLSLLFPFHTSLEKGGQRVVITFQLIYLEEMVLPESHSSFLCLWRGQLRL